MSNGRWLYYIPDGTLEFQPALNMRGDYPATHPLWAVAGQPLDPEQERVAERLLGHPVPEWH